MVLEAKREQTSWLVVCYIAFLPLSWAAFFFGSFYRIWTIFSLLMFLLLGRGSAAMQPANTRLVKAWMIFSLYSVVSVLWAENSGSAFTEALGMALLCIAAFIFATCNIENPEKLLDNAWITAGIICLLLFFWGEREIVGDRETLIILGTPTDHNEFAGVFVVPIALKAHRLMKPKSTGLKIAYILLILMEFYAILLTGSRGALLAAIIAVAITALTSRKVSFKYFVTALVLLLFVVYLINSFVLPLIPETVLDRFSVEAVEASGGSGRAEIWEEAWGKISQGSLLRLFFGYGSGAELVIDHLGNARVMHNQLLQMLANYGIVGLVLYLRLTWVCFGNLLRRNSRYIGGFCGMMVLSMTLSMSPSYKPLWILLIMAFLTTEIKEKL